MLELSEWFFCTCIKYREEKEGDVGMESLVRIFKKANPQYKKHGLTDQAVPEKERKVLIN